MAEREGRVHDGGGGEHIEERAERREEHAAVEIKNRVKDAEENKLIFFPMTSTFALSTSHSLFAPSFFTASCFAASCSFFLP